MTYKMRPWLVLLLSTACLLPGCPSKSPAPHQGPSFFPYGPPSNANTIAPPTGTTQAPQRRLPLTQNAPLPGSQLLRLLPNTVDDLFFIRRLGDLPPKADAFLTRFEGKKEGGQLRYLLTQRAKAFGIDLLNPNAMKKQGFDLDGSLLAAYTRFHKRQTLLVAISIRNTTKFEKTLRDFAQKQLVVNEMRKSKIGAYNLVTAYGKNDFDQPVEEFSYAIQGKVALLVIDLGQPPVLDPSAKPVHTTWGRKAVEKLAQLQPANSLLRQTRFQNAIRQLTSNELLLYYRPNRQWSNKKRNAPPKQAINIRARNIQALINNPAVLLNLRQHLPWKWSTITAAAGQEGFQFRSFLRLTSTINQQLQSLKNETGKPEEMVKSIHKKAIASLKLSLKPTQLDPLFRKATQNFPIKAQQIYDALEKTAGINLPKEVLPGLAGHAYFNLYHVNSRVIQRWNRHPVTLLGFLEAAIVTELNDPKSAKVVFERLAKTLKIGTKTVQRVVKKDGRVQYYMAIPAWRGTVAHWTIQGRYFIYSIGPRAINLTLDALKNPKQRLFAHNKQAGVLTSKGNGALYLNIPRLGVVLNTLDLSPTIQMALTFGLQMVKRVQGISISFGPEEKGLMMQGELRLD